MRDPCRLSAPLDEILVVRTRDEVQGDNGKLRE
jgi:hypothetical protein